MALLFFYGRDAAQFGPFSATNMRALAACGDILPTDSVWQDGATQRCEAAKVKNLFATSRIVLPALLPPQAAAVADQALPEPAVSKLETESTSATPLPRQIPGERRVVQEAPRKKRVISIKGGVLMGQDGIDMKYKKKCQVCGYEDPSRSNAVIRTGSTRISFFCRTCRKARSVEWNAIG